MIYEKLSRPFFHSALKIRALLPLFPPALGFFSLSVFSQPRSMCPQRPDLPEQSASEKSAQACPATGFFSGAGVSGQSQIRTLFPFYSFLREVWFRLWPFIPSCRRRVCSPLLELTKRKNGPSYSFRLDEGTNRILNPFFSLRFFFRPSPSLSQRKLMKGHAL